jgi:hypothetical protein
MCLAVIILTEITLYSQTMASKGVNPLIAIQMALAGKINSMG